MDNTSDDFSADLKRLFQEQNCDLDEPESVALLVKLRTTGVLTARDWTETLDCMLEALVFLKQQAVSGQDNQGVINIDADPRNSDWLRIIRIWRLAECKLPYWASLWLGRFASRRNDKEKDIFWRQVGEAALAMGFESFQR